MNSPRTTTNLLPRRATNKPPAFLRTPEKNDPRVMEQNKTEFEICNETSPFMYKALNGCTSINISIPSDAKPKEPTDAKNFTFDQINANHQNDSLMTPALVQNQSLHLSKEEHKDQTFGSMGQNDISLKSPNNLKEQLVEDDASALIVTQPNIQVNSLLSQAELDALDPKNQSKLQKFIELTNLLADKKQHLAMESNFNSKLQQELAYERQTSLKALLARKAENENIIEELNSHKSQVDQSLDLLQKDSLKHSAQRKSLYKMMQHLKGMFRVYCRVKPIDQDQDSAQLPMRASTPYSMTSIVQVHKINNSSQNWNLPISLHLVNQPQLELKTTISNESFTSNFQKQSLFTFDGVFDVDSTQQQVFTEMTPLIRQALFNGTNCNIFALGFPSSGKTYTVQGTTITEQKSHKLTVKNNSSQVNNNSLNGILPRVGLFIFEEIQKSVKLYHFKIKPTVEISAFEVSTGKDLLSGREDNIENRVWQTVNDSNQFMRVCNTAIANKIKETENKSCSYVYQVRFTGVDKLMKSQTSILTIVDLASFGLETSLQQHTSSVYHNNQSDVNKLRSKSAVPPKSSKLLKQSLSGNIQQQKSKKQIEFEDSQQTLSNLIQILSALSSRKQTTKKSQFQYKQSRLTKMLQDQLNFESNNCLILTVHSDKQHQEQTDKILKFANTLMN